MKLKDIVITKSTMDTESAPTKETGITSTTIIKDIGMNTMAIGDLGINGSGIKRNILTFTEKETTIEKTPT